MRTPIGAAGRGANNELSLAEQRMHQRDRVQPMIPISCKSSELFARAVARTAVAICTRVRGRHMQLANAGFLANPLELLVPVGRNLGRWAAQKHGTTCDL